jgi:hypothetical protein
LALTPVFVLMAFGLVWANGMLAVLRFWGHRLLQKTRRDDAAYFVFVAARPTLGRREYAALFGQKLHSEIMSGVIQNPASHHPVPHAEAPGRANCVVVTSADILSYPCTLLSFAFTPTAMRFFVRAKVVLRMLVIDCRELASKHELILGLGDGAAEGSLPRAMHNCRRRPVHGRCLPPMPPNAAANTRQSLL